MDKEDENFWFGSEISDRKGNFFDSVKLFSFNQMEYYILSICSRNFS